MNWVLLIIVLIVANFLWELFKGKSADWHRAFEWSWAQTAAVLIVLWVKPWEG